MPVPPFQEITRPLLLLMADGKTRSLSEVRERIADGFGLSPADRDELLPSGRQTRLANRVTWAKVYLERAGLLSTPSRGHLVITERGRHLAAAPPDVISVRFLERFPEFVEFRASRGTRRNEANLPDDGEAADSTPEESLDAAYEQIRRGLASELLNRIRSAPPQFFEQLVVDLLLKMGYGAARRGAGEAIGRSGDEGIDGVISEDRLGLEQIYLQAKRWEQTVGRPEIQRFVGALHGRRARKGVFITTARFSSEALAYVNTIEPKVVLIDGEQLVEFMIDFDLGVAIERTYAIKRIDSDYFETQ